MEAREGVGVRGGSWLTRGPAWSGRQTPTHTLSFPFTGRRETGGCAFLDAFTYPPCSSALHQASSPWVRGYRAALALLHTTPAPGPLALQVPASAEPVTHGSLLNLPWTFGPGNPSGSLSAGSTPLQSWSASGLVSPSCNCRLGSVSPTGL